MITELIVSGFILLALGVALACSGFFIEKKYPDARTSKKLYFIGEILFIIGLVILLPNVLF